MSVQGPLLVKRRWTKTSARFDEFPVVTIIAIKSIDMINIILIASHQSAKCVLLSAAYPVY